MIDFTRIKVKNGAWRHTQVSWLVRGLVGLHEYGKELQLGLDRRCVGEGHATWPRDIHREVASRQVAWNLKRKRYL